MDLIKIGIASVGVLTVLPTMPIFAEESTSVSIPTYSTPEGYTPSYLQQGVKNENGKRVYYKNGVVDTSVTGLAQDQTDYKWYFFQNGVFQNYTGIAKSLANGKYYVVRNGILDWNFTGIAKNIDDGQYHFVRKGVQGEKFTGWSRSIVDDEYYFTRDGVLDWGFTGVAVSVDNGEWYHGKNGKLDWNFTGISQSIENGKWYFSRNGQLDWKFTGVAQSVADSNWYHCKNGELDWNFIGFSTSVENGKWYFSRNGKLDWNFTGLAKSIANGEYYFARNGQLDWNYTGGAKSITNEKWYAVTKGTLNWKYDGKLKCTDGKERWFKSGQFDSSYNGFDVEKLNSAKHRNVGVWKNGVLKGITNLVSQKDKSSLNAGMGPDGCAPTSFANAINLINGNSTENTVKIGNFLKNYGLYAPSIGRGVVLSSARGPITKHFGLQTKTINNVQQFKEELDKGHPVLLTARTDYNGNYTTKNNIVHAQTAFARSGNTVYVAEALGGKNGVVPYVRTVNINDLFNIYRAADFFSVYK